MDADVLSILKESNLMSLINELVIHRELAAHREQPESVRQKVKVIETLQCTTRELQGTVRDLQDTIEQLRNDLLEMETKLQSEEQDHRAASDTIEYFTTTVEELRETLQEVEEARVCWTKKVQAREDTIVELRGELCDAQATISAQRALLNSVNSLRRPFAHLPQEIVRMILAKALCPSAFVDPTLHPGLNSAWIRDLRTKESFSLVCKAWRSIGLALMYETVSIRRIGQISALMDVLESDSSRGDLVKSIDISCVIPDGYYPPRIRRELLVIFQSCPMTTSITFGSATPWDPDSFPQYGWASYLTHFDGPQSLPSNTSQLVNLLQCCPKLQSLNLWVDSFTDERLPMFALNALEILHLTIHSDGLGIYHAMAESCSMPSLQSLILTEIKTLRSDWPAAVPQRESFFAKYGPGLKYLHLRPRVTLYRDDIKTFEVDVQVLLNSCPNLEHLAISPQCVSHWPPPLSHPHIQWIDFWQRDFRVDDIAAHSVFTTGSFPSLKGVRRLDGRADGLPQHTDWPSVLPPWTQLRETELREYIYSGIIIRQTSVFVYRSDTKDIDWAQEINLGSGGTDYDSSDDSSYNQPEESDGSLYSDDENREVDYDTGLLFSNEDTGSH